MKIVLTPDWFIGKDILIEFVSFIVLLVFSLLAFKDYRFRKNKKVFYLGIGFGLIMIAQLASIFTKLVLYYDIGPSQAIGTAIVTSNIVSSVDIFYYIGFFFHRFLTLIGFFVIYRLPQKKIVFGDYALIFYFILLSSIISQEFDYFFHLTAFILLILITKNYYELYKKNKFVNTKILTIAFSILALGQIVYLLSKLDIFFAVANIIELISYIIMLFLVIMILKHGKKKKSYGDNIRHTRNNSKKGW